MSDADLVTAGVVIGIVVFAIIIILIASRNAKGGAVVQDFQQQPPHDKPDKFSPENNRPIGNTLKPSTLSFCPSCGRRLHGMSFICPYCKKKI
jgi:hypothetical protein